jgi:hypothetical protein
LFGGFVANYYVDSVNGSDSNGGTSWADAKAKLTTLWGLGTASTDPTGVIYLSHEHSEAYQNIGSYDFYYSGSTSRRIPIISADRTSGTPPTVFKYGATIDLTNLGNYSFFGTKLADWFGVRIIHSCFNYSSVGMYDSSMENCVFVAGCNSYITAYGNSCFKLCTFNNKVLYLNANEKGQKTFIDCYFETYPAYTTPNLIYANFLTVYGGKLDQSTDLTTSIAGSGLGFGYIFGSSYSQFLLNDLTSNSLPSSYSGQYLQESTYGSGLSLRGVSCSLTGAAKMLSALAATYKFYKTFPAIKLLVSSNAEETYEYVPVVPRYSEWMSVWNTSTSAITVRLELLIDIARSTMPMIANSLFMDVMYPGSASDNVWSLATTRPSNIFDKTTTVPHGVGLASWTDYVSNTEQLTSHKLYKQITPAVAGPIFVRVASCRNLVAYIEPQIFLD